MKCKTLFISRLLACTIVVQPFVGSISLYAMYRARSHYVHTTQPSPIGKIKQKVTSAYYATKQWMSNNKLFLSGIGTTLIGYYGYQWFWQYFQCITEQPAPQTSPLQPQQSELGQLATELMSKQALRDVRSLIAYHLLGNKEETMELFKRNAPTIKHDYSEWYVNPHNNHIYTKDHFTIAPSNMTQWHPHREENSLYNSYRKNEQITVQRGFLEGLTDVSTHTNGSYIMINKGRGFDIYNSNNRLIRTITKNDAYALQAHWTKAGDKCMLIFIDQTSTNKLIEVIDPSNRKIIWSTGRIDPSFSKFSPNGERVAFYDTPAQMFIVLSLRDQSVQLWKHAPTSFCDWLSDDQLIMWENNKPIEIYQTGGKKIRELAINTEKVIQTILSPDKKHIFTISRNTVGVMNLETGTHALLLNSNEPFNNNNFSGKCSSDNQFFTAILNGMIYIWDIRSKQLKYRFASDLPCIKLEWTDDNKLVYGTTYPSRGSIIRVLDIPILDRLMARASENIRITSLLYAKLNPQQNTAPNAAGAPADTDETMATA